MESGPGGESGFSGPFFIVGMPRSGTKLLRDLMNEHPKIAITNIETHFLPYWVRHKGRYGDLADRSNFARFYRETVKLPYFLYMAERGALIEEDVWHGLCRTYSLAGVFEALVRHDADAGYSTDTVWGDKTPAYINHVSLLRELFPGARIIHIVRDVRDYCLSVKKAWGKNMLRAAQRWRDDIRAVRATGRELSRDYLEIRYEDLLNETEATLRTVCNFLSVEFDPRMVSLSKPSENLGDARGWSSIKKDNTGKYRHLMSARLREKIEAIAGPCLKESEYPVEYRGAPTSLDGIRMLAYKVGDGLMVMRYRFRSGGLKKAIKWSHSFQKVKR